MSYFMFNAETRPRAQARLGAWSHASAEDGLAATLFVERDMAQAVKDWLLPPLRFEIARLPPLPSTSRGVAVLVTDLALPVVECLHVDGASVWVLNDLGVHILATLREIVALHCRRGQIRFSESLLERQSQRLARAYLKTTAARRGAGITPRKDEHELPTNPLRTATP